MIHKINFLLRKRKKIKAVSTGRNTRLILAGKLMQFVLGVVRNTYMHCILKCDLLVVTAGGIYTYHWDSKD